MGATTDIKRFLPNNEYQAAVNANAPTALNPFATVADVTAGNTNFANADLILTDDRLHEGDGFGIEFTDFGVVEWDVQEFSITTGLFDVQSQGEILLQTNAGDNIRLVTDLTSALVIPTSINPTANVLSPIEGMLKGNTTSKELEYYDGTSWVSLVGAATPTLQQVMDTGSTATGIATDVDIVTTAAGITFNAVYAGIANSNITVNDLGILIGMNDTAGGGGDQLIWMGGDTYTVGIEVTDSAASTGFFYIADYSNNGIANHSNRWIPDYGAVKAYTDLVVGAYLPLAGGTMTGAITLTSGEAMNVVDNAYINLSTNKLSGLQYQSSGNEVVLYNNNTGGNVALDGGQTGLIKFEHDGTPDMEFSDGALAINKTYSLTFGLAVDSFYGNLVSSTITTSDKTWTLPDQSGTIALLSDITGGNTLYTADDTIGINRVATLTNSITFKGATDTAVVNFVIRNLSATHQLQYRNNGTLTNTGVTEAGQFLANGAISGYGVFGFKGNSTNIGRFLPQNLSGYINYSTLVDNPAQTMADKTGAVKVLLSTGGNNGSYFMNNVGFGTTNPLGAKIRTTGGDVVFEGLTDLNLFTADYSADRVIIGASTGLGKFHVKGGDSYFSTDATHHALKVQATGGRHILTSTNVANTTTWLQLANDLTSFINLPSTIGLHIGSTAGVGVTAKLTSKGFTATAAAAFQNAGGTSTSVIEDANGRTGIGITGAGVTSKLTVAGDVETTGAGEGVIVLDDTNGTRYRIYMSNGVLTTQLA